MGYLIKVNGSKANVRDSEFKFGQMGQNMWDSGKIIKLMDMELYIMQMGIFIKENGLTIKLVVKEHILIKMGQNMLDNGRMTNKTDMVFSNGQMEKFMKVNIKMVQKQERVS
jgi:hypothetical protein